MKNLIYILFFVAFSAQAQFYEIGGSHMVFDVSFAEVDIETTDGSDYQITFQDGNTITGTSGENLRYGYSSNLNFIGITSLSTNVKSISLIQGVEIDLSVLASLSNLETFTDEFSNGSRITGDLGNFPTSILKVHIQNSTSIITGDIGTLAGINYLNLIGTQITATGNIETLAGIDFLRLNGPQITATGDIGTLAGINTLYLNGNQIIANYTQTSWVNAPSNRFEIFTIEIGLTQTEVDNLLIDLSNATSIPSSGTRIITITGNNSAPSSASASAIAFLQSKGYTITTN